MTCRHLWDHGPHVPSNLNLHPWPLTYSSPATCMCRIPLLQQLFAGSRPSLLLELISHNKSSRWCPLLLPVSTRPRQPYPGHASWEDLCGSPPFSQSTFSSQCVAPASIESVKHRATMQMWLRFHAPATAVLSWADSAPQGPWGNAWRSFWLSQRDVSGLQRLGKLLTIIQCTRQLTSKNCLAPNGNSVSLPYLNRSC